LFRKGGGHIKKRGGGGGEKKTPHYRPQGGGEENHTEVGKDKEKKLMERALGGGLRFWGGKKVA